MRKVKSLATLLLVVITMPLVVQPQASLHYEVQNIAGFSLSLTQLGSTSKFAIGFSNQEYVDIFDALNPTGTVGAPTYTSQLAKPGGSPAYAGSSSNLVVCIQGTEDKLLIYKNEHIYQLNLTTQSFEL